MSSSLPTPASLLDVESPWKPVSITSSVSAVPSCSLTPSPPPSISLSTRGQGLSPSPSLSPAQPVSKERNEKEEKAAFSRAVVKPPPPVVVVPQFNWSPAAMLGPSYTQNSLPTVTEPSYTVEELGTWVAPKERRRK